MMYDSMHSRKAYRAAMLISSPGQDRTTLHRIDQSGLWGLPVRPAALVRFGPGGCDPIKRLFRLALRSALTCLLSASAPSATSASSATFAPSAPSAPPASSASLLLPLSWRLVSATSASMSPAASAASAGCFRCSQCGRMKYNRLQKTINFFFLAFRHQSEAGWLVIGLGKCILPGSSISQADGWFFSFFFFFVYYYYFIFSPTENR